MNDQNFTPQNNEQQFEQPQNVEQVQTPEEPLELSFFEKITTKKNLPIFIGVVAALIVIVIALITIGSLAGNNYKTPIKNYEKILNLKADTLEKSVELNTNGFTEKEIKFILKVMKKSQQDQFDDYEDSIKDKIDEYKDEYGKNFKYTIKINEKEKLEKSELKDFRDKLRKLGDELESIEEKTKEYTSDDWDDMAEELDVSKSTAKSLVSDIKKLGKVLDKAEVKKGYKLDITITLKGSELDEPEERDTEILVYKVNGRWISSSFTSLLGGISLS